MREEYGKGVFTFTFVSPDFGCVTRGPADQNQKCVFGERKKMRVQFSVGGWALVKSVSDFAGLHSNTEEKIFIMESFQKERRSS